MNHDHNWVALSGPFPEYGQETAILYVTCAGCPDVGPTRLHLEDVSRAAVRKECRELGIAIEPLELPM